MSVSVNFIDLKYFFVKLVKLTSICLITLVLVGCNVGQSFLNIHSFLNSRLLKIEPLIVKKQTCSSTDDVIHSFKSRKCSNIEIYMDAVNNNRVNALLINKIFNEDTTPKNWRKTLKCIVEERASQVDEDKVQIHFLKETSELLFFNAIEKTSFLHFSGEDRTEYISLNIVIDKHHYRQVKLKDILVPGAQNSLFKLQKRYVLQALIANPKRTLQKEQLRGWVDILNNSLSDNWGFDDKHILFSYSPYEAAPFSELIIEVKIPFEELKGIIKPEYLQKLEKRRLK